MPEGAIRVPVVDEVKAENRSFTPAARAQASARRIPERIFVSLVKAYDLAVIGLSGVFGYWIYLADQSVDIRYYMLAAALGTLVASQILQGQRLYTVSALSRLGHQIRTILVVWTMVVAALITVGFFLRVTDEVSRGWICIWYAAGLAGLIVGRGVIAARIGRWQADGVLVERIVVIGGGEIGQRFLDRLRTEQGSGVQILGVFDDRRSRLPEGGLPAPWLGPVSALADYVQVNEVDTVVIAMPLYAERRVLSMIHAVRSAPVDIRVLADNFGFHFPDRPLGHIHGVPALNVIDRPIKEWGGVAKAIEDRVSALVALALLGPVMLAVALAIKLDSRGPVLYRQRRRGFNNRDFDCFKFRSMYVSDAPPTTLTTRGDPRVTRVGRFIRKTSLDELPQLLNVLRGDMSIVGPRPHALFARAADIPYDEAVADYAARHRVKPGITGWAQVNGWRGPTETLEQIQKRVEHDLYYIDNWSVLFDIWIMILTVTRGMTGRNAF